MNLVINCIVPWLGTEISDSDGELLICITVIEIGLSCYSKAEYYHLMRDLELSDDKFRTYCQINKEHFVDF